MKRPAVELLLAMIEYAIAIGQEKIATFLYSSLKTSIQWSLGWDFSPLGDAFILKEDQDKALVKKKSSLIGEYPVNEAVLEKIRAKVGLYKPMLHSTTVVEVSDLEAFLISQNYSLFPKKSPKKSLSIKRGFSKEGTMCMK